MKGIYQRPSRRDTVHTWKLLALEPYLHFTQTGLSSPVKHHPQAALITRLLEVRSINSRLQAAILRPVLPIDWIRGGLISRLNSIHVKRDSHTSHHLQSHISSPAIFLPSPSLANLGQVSAIIVNPATFLKTISDTLHPWPQPAPTINNDRAPSAELNSDSVKSWLEGDSRGLSCTRDVHLIYSSRVKLELQLSTTRSKLSNRLGRTNNSCNLLDQIQYITKFAHGGGPANCIGFSMLSSEILVRVKAILAFLSFKTCMHNINKEHHMNNDAKSWIRIAGCPFLRRMYIKSSNNGKCMH